MIEYNREYTYSLPSNESEYETFTTNCNSVIIVGANGSGKSKLGAWIEDHDDKPVHRIGGQRDLNFQENIAISGYDLAVNKLQFIFNDEDTVNRRYKGYRWNDDKGKTTTLLKDFDDSLSALASLYYNQTADYYNQSKKAKINNLKSPEIEYTVIDKLNDIWNEIFPHRSLEFEDSKFYSMERKENSKKYSANQMSDGERSVLYLVSQVLVIPEGHTLIIDEPELHLHGSIMNILWDKLESYRKDCLFIYITHDTSFAANHKGSDKIWVKEYDGNRWEYEKLKDANLPEKLLLEILGSRKNVLFVEGEQNSYDYKLYSLIYPNFHIIPSGSCNQVISRTKSFNDTSKIHNFNTYGIIDRDFRSEEEIEILEKSNIHTIDVAEVENLFLVEELIIFFAEHLSRNKNEVLEDVKNYIINERFKKQLDDQINKSIISEIKYKLNTVEISNISSIESLSKVLENIKDNLNYEEKSNLYNTCIQEKKYSETLKLFNDKGLVRTVGHFFGIKNNEYQNMILDILSNQDHSKILEIFKEYLPNINN